MKTKRLLKLADFLRNVVAKEKGTFNIRAWGRKTECGTVCCAMGHAPRIWPKLLKLEWSKNSSGDVVGSVISRVWRDPFLMSRNLRGSDLAEKFFGLNYHQARSIFMDEGYGPDKVTPKMVAHKIERVVKRDRLKKSNRIYNN